MSNTRWGVDTCAAATASIATSVQNFSGGSATFWGRYFRPIGSAPCVAMDAELPGPVAAEAVAMKGAGIRFVVPLTTPGPTRTKLDNNNGGYNAGHQDGAAVCNAINLACKNSGYTIVLPGNDYLRVYLDIERGQAFTTAYWQGWWDGVYYSQAYNNTEAFYPCCYCNPNDGNACSVLTAASSYFPIGVWSNQPENGSGSYCSIPGPGWNPPTAPLKCAGVYTLLWQYAETVSCSPSQYDLDQSTPGEDEAAYMLYLP